MVAEKEQTESSLAENEVTVTWLTRKVESCGKIQDNAGKSKTSSQRDRFNFMPKDRYEIF